MGELKVVTSTIALGTTFPKTPSHESDKATLFIMTDASKFTTAPSLTAIGRWARLKKYRIEVTYGIYVFTPGEKFMFWSLFASILGLIAYYLSLFLAQTLFPVAEASWGSIYGAYSSNGRNSASISDLTSQLTQHAPSIHA